MNNSPTVNRPTRNFGPPRISTRRNSCSTARNGVTGSASAALPRASASTPGTLQVSSIDGKHWKAEFSPTDKTQRDYEITAAVLISDLGTDVKAGENAGHHLQHDFAALSLITRPITVQTNNLSANFIIDDNPKGFTGRLALAVWVTRAGELEPLQATGGWLPKQP